MIDKFNGLIKKYESKLAHNNKIYDVIGYIKLLLVILLGVSLYFTISNDLPLHLTAISAVLLLLLIIIWFYHAKLREKINYLKGLIEINNKHLSRLSGKWVSFKDTGDEFIDYNHPYACDLDIIGKKSMFQFLNAASTWHGRQAFAFDLLNASYSKNDVLKRQQAISELSNKIEFCNDLEYYFSDIGINSLSSELINELKDKKSFLENNALKLFLSYFPIFTVLFISATFIFDLKNLYFIDLVLIASHLILWGSTMLKSNKYLGGMENLKKLNSYSVVIDILKNAVFSTDKLREIQSVLGKSDYSASKAIKDLDRIANKISMRHNGIVFFILNLFLLWDIGCALSLEKWKFRYSHLSEQWFLALGEFESLLSFSRLPLVCGNTCLPYFSDTRKTIKAHDLGHPLITDSTRVNNDITDINNIIIISGSNMSGKTTFLRTVGINLVLARAGSFVCAKEMHFSPMKILTSMRIADDLNEGISTFYAELKRIKLIIDTARDLAGSTSNNPVDSDMIFLIDEIFRGTNSIDRLSGAKTVIARLNEMQIMGIITTHDLELCTLANEHPRIKNYSFSEYYEDGKICFDYKMRPGKSNTTNAKFLMEMVGLFS